MLRQTTIVLGVAALLAAGSVAALAANSHGMAVSKFNASTTLDGKVRGEGVSALARTHADVTADASTADSSADSADREAESDADKVETGDHDGHGDAVSLVAKESSLVGGAHHNHGGAVSAIARTKP